jgi:hypothetical protein
MKKHMSGSISIYVEGCEMICPICKEKVESGKGHAHDFSYTSGGKSEERIGSKAGKERATSPSRRKSNST